MKPAHTTDVLGLVFVLLTVIAIVMLWLAIQAQPEPLPTPWRDAASEVTHAEE